MTDDVSEGHAASESQELTPRATVGYCLHFTVAANVTTAIPYYWGEFSAL